jgi:hypothetical protein
LMEESAMASKFSADENRVLIEVAPNSKSLVATAVSPALAERIAGLLNKDDAGSKKSSTAKPAAKPKGRSSRRK